MLDAAPGIGALAQAPMAPIAMPIIVPPIVVPPVALPPLVAPPGLGFGGGPGGPGGPRGPNPGSGPREVNTDPRTGRQPEVPVRGGDPGVPPATTFRVGYVEYLRTAGMSQIAAVAVPGVAGILALTGAGGLVGYRQAKAGRAVRSAGTARFVE